MVTLDEIMSEYVKVNFKELPQFLISKESKVCKVLTNHNRFFGHYEVFPNATCITTLLDLYCNKPWKGNTENFPRAVGLTPREAIRAARLMLLRRKPAKSLRRVICIAS